MLLISGLFIAGCQSTQSAATDPGSVNIPAGVIDPAVWGKAFPEQYASYLKNNESSKEVSQFEKQPLLPELFKGYTFAKEYNETKGHTYSLQDTATTKRVNAKTTAGCLHCHSAEFPRRLEEYGVGFYSKPFDLMSKTVSHPVSCSDCHDSQTMELKITRPSLIKALKRKGIDVSKATRQEMRSYVCAQCHVEYYFEKKSKEVVFPWAKGYNPDDMEKYYTETNYSDWEHPDSQTKLIKAQHPEYETWQSSPHAKAGASCSDCHMPKQKAGSKTISSHLWTSPLKSIEQSCTKCHKEGSSWLKKEVDSIQEKTDKLTVEAEKASLDAHQAVQKALAVPGSDRDLIKQAQDMIVRGQFRWDFVSAENSSGFHNPELSLETLNQSIDYSRKAEAQAEKALPK